MIEHKNKPADPIILTEGQGRVYHGGTMTAIFKADEGETNENYSLLEGWLEPDSDSPGAHQHEANDEVFDVLKGTISIRTGSKWIHAKEVAFIRIPANTLHDFENETNEETAVLNFFIPGGFERDMPAIVKWSEDKKP